MAATMHITPPALEQVTIGCDPFDCYDRIQNIAKKRLLKKGKKYTS